MNILIPHSWLREYLQTNASPYDIQRCLSLCGQSVERLKQVDGDFVSDIEVTTNRVDCMSVIGIAREAVAILPKFGFTAKLIKDPFKKHSLQTTDKVSYLDVEVDNELCKTFAAVLITDVKVKKSPSEVIKKLELVGQRSLNSVVDVSNLLMHEYGQPIHTFDYDKIVSHQMNLRKALKSEEVTTLDGQKLELNGGEIVISDGSGNLIDLCGIMGGKNSAVDENTKNVLVFVQTYNSNLIRKTSMSTGLRTNAAVIFEKQIPHESVLPTLQKAAQLIKSFSGGKISSETLYISNESDEQKVINLAIKLTPFAQARLGVKLEPSETSEILKSLGFKIVKDTQVTIPWFRKYDINIPEDLVEEIARIYGYHNLPSQLMESAIPTSRPLDEIYLWEQKIRQALKYWGYTETYTYSLVSQDNGLKLKNPLSSEWVYLRTNLTESHLQVISENQGRVRTIQIFEISKVYIPQEGNLPREDFHLVISSSPGGPRYIKGIVEALSKELGVELLGNIITHSNPKCVTFECNLTDILSKATQIKKFIPISKFSPVIEDVNINYSGNYKSLEEKVKNISPLIIDIQVVDIYLNKITLQVTYLSSEKQLSKDDIAPIRSQLEVLTN